MLPDQQSEQTGNQIESVASTAASGGHVLLTRGQAARRMGVSLATVRRMEGSELHPIIVDGKHCFPLEDIDRHRRVTDGDLAAMAFQMFNDDKTQVEAVITLKESPERIRKLFQDWLAMSECIIAGPPGIGYRRFWQVRGFRPTRALVALCVSLVMADPKLRERAERQLGYPLGPRL